MRASDSDDFTLGKFKAIWNYTINILIPVIHETKREKVAEDTWLTYREIYNRKQWLLDTEAETIHEQVYPSERTKKSAQHKSQRWVRPLVKMKSG